MGCDGETWVGSDVATVAPIDTLRLAVLSGAAAGETFALHMGGLIGRAEFADVSIDDQWLSHRHALIRVDASGRIWLADLGSTNGTYLNGLRVSAELQLQDGDKIQFGLSTVARFHCAAPRR
jgi:predicted component of type VI protein secretion system